LDVAGQTKISGSYSANSIFSVSPVITASTNTFLGLHYQPQITPSVAIANLYARQTINNINPASANSLGITMFFGDYNRLDLGTNYSGNVTTAHMYAAITPTITGSGTIGSLYEFVANDVPSAAVTTAIGFFANMAAGTNRYAFYSQGGAVNYFSGKTGIGSGLSAPTAKLHLGAGTGGATTAPLKLTAGTVMTVPEDGAIEYGSSHLWFTVGTTRYQLDRQLAAYGTSAGELTYTLTSSIAFIGGTPPITVLTATYRWTQVRDTVTVRFNFIWATPGVNNANMQFDLPADLPTPEQQTGFTGSGATISTLMGGLLSAVNLDTAANAQSRGGIHVTPTASSGFTVSITGATTNVKAVIIMITYFTSIII